MNNKEELEGREEGRNKERNEGRNKGGREKEINEQSLKNYGNKQKDQIFVSQRRGET